MGKTKTSQYSAQQIQLASVAKALGHPARIAIVQELIKTNSCICGDIVESLPLSQSTVSQHLKELKSSGLIKGDINGTSVCYCIDKDVWDKASKSLSGLFESYSLSCC